MSQTLRFGVGYWIDGKWYVGHLPQVPGVFSQGATLGEFERKPIV